MYNLLNSVGGSEGRYYHANIHSYGKSWKKIPKSSGAT